MTTPDPRSRLFGPVADTDRRRWQLRDTAALSTILTAAHEAGLPPLTRSIGTGGLHGQITDSSLSTTDRRAIFHAWATFLDLTPWPDNPPAGSWISLRATGAVPPEFGRPITTVGLSARLAPDEPAFDPTTEEC